MVQEILNDMDSDDVNSISDTVESMQVASIIRACYFEMMSNRDWPHLKKLAQLEASGDLARPTHLRLPFNTKEMLFLRYNKKKQETDKDVYQDLTFIYPDEFLRYISGRDSEETNVTVVEELNGVRLLIKNNVHPTYYTSFDDFHVVCDAYDKDVDDTLKKSKNQAHLVQAPSFEIRDDYVPDLPIEAFSALIEESKSTAFLNLKQMANEKAEQKASRQQRWLSRKAWRVHGGIRYDNYGRRPKK